MRILVTLDGSQFSEAILPSVAPLAAGLKADVELLMVLAPDKAVGRRVGDSSTDLIPAGAPSGARFTVPNLADVLPRHAETREQAIERLDAEASNYLRAHARDLPGVLVTTHVMAADHPAEAIVERARATKADLIAMATHGRSGLSHLLAGSVAERVIRSGVAPVLVLRPKM